MTQNPTLRIPHGWSFSIGFDGDTFTGMGDIRYAVLQADVSPLPSWIPFNSDEITLNGPQSSALTVTALSVLLWH